MSQFKKQHLVDKMGDMNIWQIWGEVYMNNWNLQNTVLRKESRGREFFAELLTVAPYVLICR